MQRTAAIIGSGPNGLAAAIALAQAGLSVTIYESAAVIGGATRSAELTLPGFVHDLGSAVHPLAVSSPFFHSLPLKDHGLEWIYPSAELAHPLLDGPPLLVERSLDATAAQLGPDARPYTSLFREMVAHWPTMADSVLRPIGIPKHPILLSKFGLQAFQSADLLTRSRFHALQAKALFAGMAAHSTLPLTASFSSAFGLILGAAAHGVGWPIPRGGSHSIANALQGVLQSLGGKIITGRRINTLAELSGADLTLCDITPRQLLALSEGRLRPSYRRQLEAFRYGPGVFKADWALREPIPWKSKDCLRSATVHLGATYEEIALSEALVNEGKLPERPFVLLAQQSLFDSSRAPAGKHTAWAYCHVPNGFPGSALEAIQSQIERFAPGFRDCILACATHSTGEMHAWNENLVGGDINGGAVNFPQLFLRPTLTRYRTSLPGVYLCSSSTPPGGGVHGMCGYWAAQWALKDLKRQG